ncbi:FAD/NAD(P)-binding protein [Acuticoccus kandeliae]|uniref:FAD/NAD(P)-binding protein n=1 Tax=Acuticoccus kandeliae TaxID=2073160 RepID=UPI000D3EBA9C|nr:FAD/NAD(P)-binding protein [Acuticoccus kandeliae]
MHIAIVGGGFTGTALAIELLSQAEPGVVITLVERSGTPGRGLAYSTEEPAHLLNVAAGRMSVRVGQPHHLVEWLFRRRFHIGATYGPESFIPRQIYGQYLTESLRAAEASSLARLHVLKGEVASITATSGGHMLHLADGGKLTADRVALATGHPRPAARPSSSVLDGWSPTATARVERRERILLIGTGLTMVDQVLSLDAAGHEGPITAISRRGRVSEPHRIPRTEPKPIDGLDPRAGLRAVTREVRAAIRAARCAGEDWRPVIDGLRPHVQTIWATFDDAERARALRHLRPYWDTHRHRMAPTVAQTIVTLRETGRLTILAGTIEQVTKSAADLTVTYRPRGSAERISAPFDRVIGCTGSEGDLRVSPMLAALEAAGTIRPAPLGLGIDVAADMTCLAQDGSRSEGLFALGPPTRGALWEITAVGEIRVQCESVARTILAHRRREPAVMIGAPARTEARI